MGHKIFISYKYGDTSVQAIPHEKWWEATKVRDYVTAFQDKLTDTDHINKGEKDDESLADFKNSTIASKLRDKIFDSTITVVFISPKMKDESIEETDQWIPWEIAYSLRESKRSDRTSHRNAVIAVVLPDVNGSYTYMLEPKSCCEETCTLWHRFKLFSILSSNMFNIKNPNKNACRMGDVIYHGQASYIPMYRWDYFIGHIDLCIAIAESIRENADDYEIHVNM